MKSPSQARPATWVEQRLFPIQYAHLALCLNLQLESQPGTTYVGVSLYDGADTDHLISMSAQPVSNARDAAQVLEVVADALRDALRHLEPFPA